MTRPPLAVWLYGTRVGELTEARPGRIALAWTEEAYARWGSGSRVVSHLLPLSTPDTRPAPPKVTAFLDGLLPEGNARTNYAMDAGIAADDTFGLVSRYGRDTAGALVFQGADEPEPVRVGTYEPLTDTQVGHRLREADRHAPTDPYRRGVESISLAGMQPKIGLHRIEGTWQACRDGAPSTWILKLAHAEDSPAADVVDTEALCAELARHVGLARTDSFVTRVGGERALAVERYDRHLHGDLVTRTHQEDLAQALGLDTGDPERKFQRGRAIPSLAAAAEVLDAGGSDTDDLARLVAFNHVVGNTDFHAKNIAFVRADDGTARLAPAYDVSMHLHHRTRDPLSALDVNGARHMHAIGITDVVAEATSWGMPEGRARTVVRDVLERLTAALEHVDMARHPGVPEQAYALVTDRVTSALGSLSEPEPARRPRRSGRRGPRGS